MSKSSLSLSNLVPLLRHTRSKREDIHVNQVGLHLYGMVFPASLLATFRLNGLNVSFLTSRFGVLRYGLIAVSGPS